MVAVRNGTGHDGAGVRAAFVGGASAARELLRLRRLRMRLGIERSVLVAGAGIVGLIVLGVSAAAAAVLVFRGLSSWLTTELTWPGWTTPLVAGGALAATLLLAARRFARHWRPAKTDGLLPHGDDDERTLLDAERDARSTLRRSAEDAARFLTSPTGLLLVAAGGFAAYRALRRHPVMGSALLSAASVGRRVFGSR